jgi:hypothetical protein
MIGIDVSKSWLDAHVLLKGRVEERALRVKKLRGGFYQTH